VRRILNGILVELVGIEPTASSLRTTGPAVVAEAADVGNHGKPVFMPKRNLRTVTQDVPMISWEACNTQFKSFDFDEAERVVKAQFEAHECKPEGASQAAARIAREGTSMTPKWKRWLWIAFWIALDIATVLMWPWDWAKGVTNAQPNAGACDHAP
jgi:hypothetical protein